MSAREKVAANVANYVDERTGAASWMKKNLQKVFPDHWSFNPDLTHFARRLWLSRVDVANAQGHTRQRKADRLQPYREWVVRIRHSAIAICFAQTVDVADLAHAQVNGALNLLRCADGGAAAQAGQVVAGARRVLPQGLEDVGRAVGEGAALAFDQGERLARVEPARVLRDRHAHVAPSIGQLRQAGRGGAHPCSIRSA